MKTIFIGPFGNGKVPTNGASIKNYHILKRLKEEIQDLQAIDTDNWKRRPVMLLKMLWTISRNPNARYILSLNSGSANKLIKIIYQLVPNAEVIYWVIGGSFGKWIEQGRLKAKDYEHLRLIIVEGATMKSQLKSVGLSNVEVIPNFKEIVSVAHTERNGDIIRFVFLSRIIPLKGCDLIFEAARQLNSEGFEKSFEIDFYGPIAPEYEIGFSSKVKTMNNVNYSGFLDLRDADNYSVLAEYDAMLFPTFWPGEGCPGIVIDAYMSGLPILASDWNMNKDYVQNGENGILFQAQNQQALTDVMRNAISGKYNLADMRKHAFESIKRYDIKNVLSRENLAKLKIID